MATARHTPRNTKRARSTSTRSATRASSVYADFVPWKSATAPTWHPIKKMRYVFFRMIGGYTITDALHEIHWKPSEFWNLVDLQRKTPFLLEYQRAKLLQGRAFGDSVLTIAEGRDTISRKRRAHIEKMVQRALRRASHSKSSTVARAILDTVLHQLDLNESGTIARNKLQIDAAKWLAKAVNPMEFSEKSQLAIGTPSAPDADGTSALRPLQIQFIGPDGKAVKL